MLLAIGLNSLSGNLYKCAHMEKSRGRYKAWQEAFGSMRVPRQTEWRWLKKSRGREQSLLCQQPITPVVAQDTQDLSDVESTGDTAISGMLGNNVIPICSVWVEKYVLLET